MSRPSSSSGRRGSDTAGIGMGTPSHVAGFNAAPRQISSGSMNAPAHAQIGKYSLGDCLGRGAFGSVFRGLNWITGETVAIKQIQLTNIPRSELGEIMSEIDLLKNLKHPNIVKYKGSEKTRDYLYIILEYCENGSLQHICKRFGKFPEGLVGVYISQVLAGLLYLHDQGVIHRDIKGANILTTKDGSVKLADFGVATRTGAMSDYAVVGSPYWMAPEVIDQSGACTASDIWSLGCVVIELLEGKPPYHDLDPMPALFRIVQDDCPPLPKSASPVVKDFLMLCFQKDANLRVSARKLLKHPWMANARKQLEAITSDGSMRGRNATIYDDAVKSVQEWNEALKEPARLPPLGRSVDSGTFKARAAHPPTYTHSPPSLSPAATQRTPTRRNTRSVSRPNGARELGVTPKAPPLPSNAAVSRTSSTSPAVAANDKGIGFARTAATAAIAPMATSLLESRREIAGAPIAQETADDNWDADFEEGIPTAKIAGFDKSMTSAPDADQTIPARGAKRNQAARDASSAPKNPKTPSVEDYSDLIAADDDSHLSERIRKLQAQNSVGPRLFHPNDLKSIATASKAVAGVGTGSSSKRNSSGQRQGPLSPLVSPTTSPTGSLARRNGIARPSSPFATRSPSQSRSNSVNVEKDAKWREMRRTLGKYSENGEEDYSDVFGEQKLSERPSGTLHLTDRLSTKTWSFEKELGEDDDPFAEIDGELIEDGDLEANLARDKQARNAAFVSNLVEALRADSAEDQLVDTCDQLEQLMLDEDTGAAMRRQMLLAHGALAVVQLLEVTKSRLVLSRALGLLNVLIYDDTAAQETLCLIGAIPVVMGMTSKRFAHEIRLEAAHFIYSMCSASSLTLQFVLSCRGLKTLVDLIEDYSDQSQKELVWLGIGCINSVLELQASRNDFCRMLALEGLLEPLSAVLLLVIEDKEHEYAMTAQEQVLQTLLIFSNSDSWLKTKVATRGVLRRMLQACFLLDGKPLTLLLKSIKCLSMGGTSILDELQKADTIPTLVRVLGERAEGAHSSEIINQVLSATFSLCRLNKSRQEEAASAGVIPHLLQVVRSKSPLKQFALPILCDFAHAGKATRKAMNRDGGGVQFYLELLEDPYWQGQALEAIHIYLLEETAPVEDALLQSASIDRLVGVFTTATSGFENLLEPYLKILRLSPHGVTSAMAKSSAFIKRLIKRLDHSKAVVRLGLLRLTKLLCDSHPALIAQYKLLEVIEKLAQDDGAVLLRSAGSTTVNDKGSIRRAVSDTHVGGIPVSVSSEKDSRETVASSTLAKGSIMTPSARQQAIPSPRRSPWNQGPGIGSTPNSTKGKTSPDRTLRHAGPSIKDGLDNSSLKRPIPTHSSRSHTSSRSEMGKPSDSMAYRGSA
ncbi:hypothetical protein IE81DRAFT_335186 [Ceraceosorus guamensis]|uniref:non-specific serine/threonine protein kinase n=1 Tax=Ceraceosorus guamensis TaxID=1522189 RepID=A0A316VTW2_9BASI|nr:hypothetical protein IE81DRAFT_335186 [Ceraceosorus guamensis]PWN40644.1 hypothetical protein IE81DRAFT_335186 [Ceraceosorus guamensis]